ncbi:asparagine synthase (glutamine-hydrolyzing) [Microcoleus sp. S28C3]|uniref:asparagine synthase (glutamine-hydrolyzing) n=1 Tax=Microcoleus sp. S28C3 TaxID=3055414 RepID=UPI002FD266B5
MCGFAGFIDFQNYQQHKQPDRLEILSQMGEQLSRRGPDEEQCFDSDPLSLIFRRLSIVDLAGGQQPIWNEDKTMFVAVNGEIYNHLELRSKLRGKHQFRTHSDAEIVLHLYEEVGPDALHLLNGMFAIALWDARRQQLFLARDRLGIKPLYYAQIGSQLIFGSTLTSLLAHPNAPRHPQFQDLTNLSVTTSYVRQIHRLPGGHYLLYDANTTNLTPQCYWNLENYLVTESTLDSRQPQDYIREYRDLFVDSVKKRLMSDVPVGAFLSGGLDSGAIVAVANQFHDQLHCFSILADYTKENGDIQEARQLCERLNLPFHPVYFDSEKLLDQIHFSLDTFEYFIWIMDAPKFYLESLFKQELHRYAKTLFPDLKVMLLGQGSDEFAGGYSNPEDNSTSDWHNYIQQLTEEEQQISQAKQLTSLKDGSYLFDRTLKSYPPGCTPFQKHMLREVYYLQDFNLWHEDRNSMSQSIEARVPFLDHRLVEYLAAVPPQHHAALFWNKTIVREMAGQWLPHDFVYRKKSFGTSPPQWTRMHYRIVQRIFPQFREKYLANSRSLFSDDQILGWFNQANGSSMNGIQALDKLLNAMAMTVFKDLCKTGKPPTPMDYLYGRSPLKTLHDF